MSNSAINAGVHAATGFEFQKHCALFIILERYHQLKDEDYFVCIEHSDDLLFGFLNAKNVSRIESYQVKKSSKVWTINNEWKEIVAKILSTGKDLTNEVFARTDDYTQKISFLSNQTSYLNIKHANELTGKNETISRNISESDSCVKFSLIAIANAPLTV